MPNLVPEQPDIINHRKRPTGFALRLRWFLFHDSSMCICVTKRHASGRILRSTFWISWRIWNQQTSTLTMPLRKWFMHLRSMDLWALVRCNPCGPTSRAPGHPKKVVILVTTSWAVDRDAYRIRCPATCSTMAVGHFTVYPCRQNHQKINRIAPSWCCVHLINMGNVSKMIRLVFYCPVHLLVGHCQKMKWL